MRRWKRPKNRLRRAGRSSIAARFIVRGVGRADLDKAAGEVGLQAVALGAAPSVKTHPVRAARVAFVHTWLSTQTEGWWRLALDDMKIPYDYISTQTVAKIDDLNAKYDVILFPPVGFNASSSAIINGLPTAWGNPLPWKNTPETPNLVGKNDSTDDMRPGLGWEGVAHLQAFVAQGWRAADRDRYVELCAFDWTGRRRQREPCTEDEHCRVRCWARGWWMRQVRSPTATRKRCRCIATTGRSFRSSSIAGERRRRQAGKSVEVAAHRTRHD